MQEEVLPSLPFDIEAIFLGRVNAVRPGGPLEKAEIDIALSVSGGDVDADRKIVKLELKVSPKLESPPFTIDLEVSCIIKRLSDKVTPEQQEEFARNNALRFLWPYAREACSDLIRRMGYNYILPPIPATPPAPKQG